MPLSGEQIQFIQSSIGHLLELPADTKQLPQQILRIRSAFQGDELKPNDDYAFIQRPTEYLRRLENAGPPISLGEVQTYLLDLANRRITEAAEAAHYQLSNNEWNREQLQKRIADDKNSKKEFKTAPPPRPRDDIPPYPIPSDPDQIYAARIGANRYLTKTYIHIDTFLSPLQKVSQTLSHISIPDFYDENIEGSALDQFMKKTAENSITIAERQAVLQILKYLVYEKIITDTESSKINNYSAILLTYSTYFNALLSEKLSFDEIANLNEKQVETLRKPAMLELIRDGKSHIDQLKDLKPNEVASLSEPYLQKLVRDNKHDIYDIACLTQEQKQLASNPYYAPMVYVNKLPLNDIKQMTTEQCKTFILPSIIYLHQKNKIKIDEILKIKKSTIQIISDEYYSKLLVNNQLDYKQIENLSDEQAQILLLPKIIKLISKEILTIETAAKLNSYVLWFINNDPIISFLIDEQIISPNDTIFISRELPSTLAKNQKIPPLKKEQLALFKSIIQDFLSLSTENLLSDKDLHYIYLHFTEINLHLNNLQNKDEKVTEKSIPSTDNKLLKIEMILKRCKINIQNRMQIILKNKLLVRDKNFSDSLTKLEADCKKFNINFNEIRNKELANALTRHYANPASYQLTHVFITGYDLEYKPDEMHEQVFGSRLFSIYNKRPAKIGSEYDTISKIQNDIIYIAKIEKYSTVAIQNLAIRYVFNQIKNTLQKNTNTPKLYPAILESLKYQLISKAYQKNELSEYESYQISFNYIIATLKFNYLKAQKEIYLNKDNETKYSSKIFLPKKPSNDIEELKEFCDSLSAIQTFFTLLKPLDMKIPATNITKPSLPLLTS